MIYIPPPLKVSRRAAFKKQNGHCYYCGSPMWEKSRDTFAKKYGMSVDEASRFKCTAEHLRARCDGGKDWPRNIVAACIYCNAKRHQMKNPPSPKELIELMRRPGREGRRLSLSC